MLESRRSRRNCRRRRFVRLHVQRQVTSMAVSRESRLAPRRAGARRQVRRAERGGRSHLWAVAARGYALWGLAPVPCRHGARQQARGISALLAGSRREETSVPIRVHPSAGQYATCGAAPNDGSILSESFPGSQASRRPSENAIPGPRRNPLRAPPPAAPDCDPRRDRSMRLPQGPGRRRHRAALLAPQLPLPYSAMPYFQAASGCLGQ